MCSIFATESKDRGPLRDSVRTVLFMVALILVLGTIAGYCLATPGCAAASSEITPAESSASEKSVSLTGATRKSSTLEITIGDEGEAK